MNQIPPPEFNPQLPPSNQNIQQNIERSVVEGDIQIIQGNNNTQTKIINYYYEYLQQNDASSDDHLPCPYKGLSHFSDDDAKLFFGRDEFVQELIDATTSCSFIPVLGASGSGKTSVVLAGLVPELKKKGNWLFIHFRPGSNPFQKLAEALVTLDASLDQAHELANNLAVLPELLNKIHQKYSNQRLLLIADQLEELYVSCPHKTIRQRFLDCLLAIIQDSSNKSKSPVVLVATMRADFLDRALEYRPFADVLKDNLTLIKPMNRNELKEVIEKPAQGLKVTFEAGLVKRILDDVEKQLDSLPLLEFALTLLWEQRKGKQLTHTAYEAIGKVSGAIASHAEEFYKNLDATDKEKVRRIFLQLVCPGEGTEDTRRLATKAELGENIWSLVQRLANAKTRLVVISRTTEDKETVEVVHEALIRKWQRLSGWIDDNRLKLLQKNRIERLAKEWQNNKRSKDYLLQGKQLNEARTFQEKESINFPLTDLASKFIQNSIRQRQNEHARVLGMILSSVVVSIFVSKVIVPWIQVQQLWEEFDTAKKQKELQKIKLVVEKLIEATHNLAKINLSNYQLDDANFSNTNLTGAMFSRTTLGRAIFKSADLTGAIFNDANLGEANFDDATLNNAKFINAKLGGAKLVRAKFRGADLRNANLGGADLGGADFSNANLNGAKFNNYANLGRVKLNGAELQKANFENAQNLTPEQVKQAKGWQQATYNKEFCVRLYSSSEIPKDKCVQPRKP